MNVPRHASRLFRRRDPKLAGLFWTLALLAVAAAAPAAAQIDPTESDYYEITTLPIPEGVVLEVGGLATLPDGRLAVATRRGEVWLVEDPTMAGGAPHFKRFAHGLHEALGLAYRDRSLYTAQRGELTRLTDTDGDERADRYDAVYVWPLDGNYHEYSYGPVLRENGNMLVTLNLAWIGHGASLSKWRGWAIEITSDGEMTPLASGMRSPAGFGLNEAGDLFYAENQGDWVGSGYITHVESGDFVGNPAGLRWSGEPESPVTLRPDEVPDTGEPLFEVAGRVPGLKPPAVWIPHALMGVSTSGILPDTTGGAFGPFRGQFFVGDQGHSRINRVFLEQVDGVYQGAVFPFREGFDSGVLRMVWGYDGSMFVGMTSRGWWSTGKQMYGLQRLEWTGRMPFEVRAVRAMSDGFELEFTSRTDRRAAGNAASYAVAGFTYQYHSTYGSPAIRQQNKPVRAVVVSDDGLRARIAVDGLEEGYIYEIKMPGVRSVGDGALLHDVAYYTLNRIPDGPMFSSASPAATSPATRDAAAAPGGDVGPRLAKRTTTMPAEWGGAPDVATTMGTLPGLRFDRDQIRVSAGARVALTFNNNDDMLHNLVVTGAGRAEQAARDAIALGLAGHDAGYVPETADVLFHTGLLAPETTQTIYFVAPDNPGEYEFVCTFPGHAQTMRGVLRVVGG